MPCVRVPFPSCCSPKPLPPGRVALLVKQCAKAAGFTEAEICHLAGHSLRSGFVTESVRRGATPFEIQQQTGHKDLNTLVKYIHEIDPLRNNAVTRLVKKP